MTNPALMLPRYRAARERLEALASASLADACPMWGLHSMAVKRHALLETFTTARAWARELAAEIARVEGEVQP